MVTSNGTTGNAYKIDALYESARLLVRHVLMNQEETLISEVVMDSDCEQEWDEAMEKCQDYLSSPNPPVGITGRCSSVYDCAKGLVSARCGGNAFNF